MSEFTAEIRARVREAEVALATARSDGDDFLAGLHETQLADLHRLAGENGVNVIDLTEPAGPGDQPSRSASSPASSACSAS